MRRLYEANRYEKRDDTCFVRDWQTYRTLTCAFLEWLCICYKSNKWFKVDIKISSSRPSKFKLCPMLHHNSFCVYFLMTKTERK